MDQAADRPTKRGPRAHTRHYVDIPGVLMTDAGEMIGPAKIRDMSGGGAKLVLPDLIQAVPSRFVMAICSSSGPRRKCSLVWQTGNVVGVRFLNDPTSQS